MHYHLAKMGYSTVLLEQNQLTSGTTWHSAGMLWRLRPNDTDIELNEYTRDLLLQVGFTQSARAPIRSPCRNAIPHRLSRS